MWKLRSPVAGEAVRMRKARAQFDLSPLVVHDSYLINLAAADEALRRKSVAAFRAELERAAALGADYLVAHPGSYRGQTLEEGIGRVAKSLVESARDLELEVLMLLLENTAGSGASIGSRFEELSAIRELAAGKTGLEIGYCLDTAHCLAAGYDIATAGGLRETVRAAGNILGMDNVRVMHANDSKAPLGSRVDRHEHIGRGYIGEEGFRRILRHPKLRRKPFILETPVDREGDDRRNLEKLKELCRKSSTTTERSSPSGSRGGRIATTSK